MRKLSVILVLFLIGLGQYACKNKQEDIAMEIQTYPKAGWMNGGYGVLKFIIQNNTDEEIKAASIIGTWHVRDKKYNHWDYDPELVLEAGEQKIVERIGWMPPQTEEFAGASLPKIEGKVVFLVGDDVKTVPYSIEVPIAKLSSPLVTKRGKYVELSLQDKTWQEVQHPEKVLRYVDGAFEKMHELTGVLPFFGDVLALKECPENPYFGYAGNPIVLNTRFVPKSVGCFDNDEIDFGWLNQIGLVFGDEVGINFNYGTFTVCQANLRLSYAIETMCAPEANLRIRSWVDKKTLLTGKAFIEEYFLPKGKVYLNDKFRTWESMTPDEYLALMYSVVQKYGWGVIKDFYRIDHMLHQKQIKLPEEVERLFLAFVVLDVCCEDDLIPLYQQWRLPINKQTIEELTKEYHLDELLQEIRND